MTKAPPPCPVCDGTTTATRSGYVCTSGALHGLTAYANYGIRNVGQAGRARFPVSVGRTGAQIGDELHRLRAFAPDPE